jgi:hypothetical protein
MVGGPREKDPSTPAPRSTYDPPQRPRRGTQREGLGEAMIKSLIRSIGASLGRVIARMILGRMR